VFPRVANSRYILTYHRCSSKQLERLLITTKSPPSPLRSSISSIYHTTHSTDAHTVFYPGSPLLYRRSHRIPTPMNCFFSDVIDALPQTKQNPSRVFAYPARHRVRFSYKHTMTAACLPFPSNMDRSRVRPTLQQTSTTLPD
jgi:hypothetical protein